MALFGNGGFCYWRLQHLGWVQWLLEMAAMKVSVVGSSGGSYNVSGFVHWMRQRLWQRMLLLLAKVSGGGFMFHSIFWEGSGYVS